MFTNPVKLSAILLASFGFACNQAAPDDGDMSPPQTTAPNTGGGGVSGGGSGGNPGGSTDGAGAGGTDTDPSDTSDGSATDDSSQGDSSQGDSDPTTDDGETSTDSPSDDLRNSYFPLGDGLTWTYDHVDPLEGTWDEVVTMTAAEYDGMPAWKVVDSPNRDGRHDIQYWVARSNDDGDTEVFRVHRDQMLGEQLELSVDYDPGFLRFNYGWTSGDTQTNEYIRRAVDAQGIPTNHLRVQEFEVISTTASVEAAGVTYENCLQFRRARDDKSSLYWFAKGIGKVRELDEVSGTIEELIEHNLE